MSEDPQAAARRHFNNISQAAQVALTRDGQERDAVRVIEDELRNVKALLPELTPAEPIQ